MRFCYARLRRAVVAGACCLLSWGTAQAQSPSWPVPALITEGFVAHQVTDAAGNVFVSGTFNRQATLGTITLTSSLPKAGFVAKWSPVSNSFVWAQALGIGQYGELHGLAISGNKVYVGGNFAGTATIGGTTLTSVQGGQDAFVTKLEDAGTSSVVGWTQWLSGNNRDVMTGLAASGNTVYVTGTFDSPNLQIGSTALTNASSSASRLSLFVAKLTDAGSTASPGWALTVGGQGAVSQAMTARGTDVYISGNFAGQATFGSISRTSLGQHDAFVAKITDAGASGSFVWVQHGGGATAQSSTLALHGSNVYMAGRYDGTAQFGANTLIAASSRGEMFVAKVADAGSSASFVWAQRLLGSGYVQAAAAQGSALYLGGEFTSAPLQLGSTVLPNTAGGANAFLTRLTDAGATCSFDWALGSAGIGSAGVYSLGIQGNTVQIAGSAGAYASLGGAPLSTYVGFLMKLADPALSTSGKRSLPELALYPQPARDHTTVSLPAGSGQHTIISLRNALGQLVRQEAVRVPATGLQYPLSLATLPPGLYAVQVETNDAAAVRPLLVQ